MATDSKQPPHGSFANRVRALLSAAHATKLTQTKGANERLHWYLAKGQVFIIQEYTGCDGVEVYAALTTTNSEDDLLEALQSRLEPERAGRTARADLIEAAKLTCQMFHRKNCSTLDADWLGDDEHEAWSALERAIAKTEAEPPDGGAASNNKEQEK